MNVTHLYCSACAEKYEPNKLYNLCEKCGKPLMVAYDLEKAAETLTKESLKSRIPTLWRYAEVLPVEKKENQVSLGEGFTPFHKADNLGAKYGLKNLYIK